MSTMTHLKERSAQRRRGSRASLLRRAAEDLEYPFKCGNYAASDEISREDPVDAPTIYTGTKSGDTVGLPILGQVCD